jgi:hypothetical protein
MTMEQESRVELKPGRYRRIRDIAGRVLLKYTDGLLPISPMNIIRRSPVCEIISYETYQKKTLSMHGIALDQYFTSPDGCTQYFADQKRYLVFYNSGSLYSQPWRLRWTLAHEIGHIALGHLLTCQSAHIFGEGLSDDEYALYEYEADYFAGMLLAYPAVLNACKVNSIEALQNLCGLSREAARCRFASFSRSTMTPSTVDALVVSHFSEAIFTATFPIQTIEPDMSRFNF